MDQGSNSLIAGFADSLNSYLGNQFSAQQQASQDKQKSIDTQANDAAKQTHELNRQKQMSDYTQNQEADLTPDIAEKVLPGGSQLVNSYNASHPGKPLKIKEGVQALKAAADQLNPPASTATTKYDKQQDALEKQAMDRMTQVRGDDAIKRTELQRDGAGQAYDTIQKAQSENRPLTELEQTDVIGQLAKARFGTVTDAIMKEMNTSTGKRGFNHMVTYLTGDPSIVGASTDATLQNLKQFVTSTGMKVDTQHDGYMGARLIKPTDLEDKRWAPIAQTGRGLSFGAQKAVSDKTYAVNSTLQDKKAALRAKLGL